MRRSLTCLLLAILSSGHGIDCAENDTKPNAEVALATHRDAWLARDIKITEPHSVLMWQSGSPHNKFYYLTWDGKKKYVDVAEVSTDSANGATKSCQYNFKRTGFIREEWPEIQRLVLPDEGDSEIGIAFSTMETRRSNSYYIRFVDFKDCRTYNAPVANQTDSSTQDATAKEERLKIMQASDAPLASDSQFDIYSNANGMYATCKVNQGRTQITCKQYDSDDKLVMNDVKYDLPTHWKADWFAIHNTRGGALLLFFSDCPNGTCEDYSRVRLTAKGYDGKRYVHKEMNLKCSDKSKLTADVTDRVDGWVCLHVVCPEVKGDTLLQYRRLCLIGDDVA